MFLPQSLGNGDGLEDADKDSHCRSPQNAHWVMYPEPPGDCERRPALSDVTNDLNSVAGMEVKAPNEGYAEKSYCNWAKAGYTSESPAKKRQL